MKKIPKIVKHIQSYSPPGVDFSFQKVISYSQLSIFRGCPLRWALHYKEGQKRFTSNIHTVFGSALHKTIQYYLQVMYSKGDNVADEENLNELFEENLRDEYKLQYIGNNKQHFCTPEELGEFFDDGTVILDYFKKKKKQYFGKRGWYLVGCEFPLTLAPHEFFPNVIYQAYLDLVMYYEPTNTFRIIDLKSSTRGWNDLAKKDEDKQFQLIFYKKFFSEKFKIPYENINVEFLILKRKIWEESKYPQSRIQSYSPPSGKIKINKASASLKEFIEEVFNKHGYKDQKYKPTPSKDSCFFCPYKNEKELCSVGV